jgi:MPBQ/MSBQ methyltransferase
MSRQIVEMTSAVGRNVPVGLSSRCRVAPTPAALRRHGYSRRVTSSTTTTTAASSSAGVGAREDASLSVADLVRPVLPSHGSTTRSPASAVFQVADLPPPVSTPSASARGAGALEVAMPPASHLLSATAAGLSLAFAFCKLKKNLDTPGRPWMDETTVGKEYDAWTDEKILEYYWGEHIHLGYYKDEDLRRGAGTLRGSRVKDFVEAKLDFVDEMLAWSGFNGTPRKVLDVGCGIGGATRHLANKFGSNTRVTGVTLSPKQARRAGELALKQGVPNAEFLVMDALEMDFPDDHFDVVWACESGEHMPDKGKYVEEMVRVLKPGGTLVIATWCQRSTPPAFTPREVVNLNYLYEEWAHPYFISINDYAMLLKGTMKMDTVETDDWTRQTIASWRHSIWVGVWDPMPVFSRPRIWYKTMRDIVCLERMRRAFGCGLMQYGMIKGTKSRKGTWSSF